MRTNLLFYTYLRAGSKIEERIKEAENVKLFYPVLGTWDRNMKNISPKKVLCLRVFLLLFYKKVIILLLRNPGKKRINAETERMMRKWLQGRCQCLPVRLECPMARLWTLSLSTKREKCLHEARSGCFTARKLRVKQRYGWEHHTEKLEHPTSLTDSLKFEGTWSRYYGLSCWRGCISWFQNSIPNTVLNAEVVSSYRD